MELRNGETSLILSKPIFTLGCKLNLFWFVTLMLLSANMMACEGWKFYHCEIGDDLYALFLSSPTKLIYVHEHGGVNKLKYPKSKNTGVYTLERDINPMGEQTSIHFNNEGYDYYLYNFISPSRDGGAIANGVAVAKNGVIISSKLCKNPDSMIRCPAYDLLPRAKSNGVLFQYNLDAMSRKRRNK